MSDHQSEHTAADPVALSQVDGFATEKKTSEKPEQQQVEQSDFELAKALTDAFCEIERTGEDGTLYIKSSPGDPENPRSWPNWKRWNRVSRFLVKSTGHNRGFVILDGNDADGWYASKAPQKLRLREKESGTNESPDLAEFGVSAEVGTVGLTTFILGFAVGPMLLAPLSEFFGRRPVYLVSFGLFWIFQLPVALAPNIQTVLVVRFLQGFFGSAPLANTGGVVHDLFGRDEGGIAVAIYALSSTEGPSFGNVVGGFIAGASGLGWRWLAWFNLIVFGFFYIVIILFLPETRDTIVMIKKAKRLRAQTGNQKIFASHEQDRESAGHLWKVSLVRPFKFLFTEPITYLSAIINGLTYGIIFLSNQAFPLIFGGGNGGHGWTSTGLINLTYLSFVIGAVIGFCLQPLQERYYHYRVRLNNDQSDPEARWYSSLYGIWLLPVGLFIAAWTSYPYITFMGPLIGFTLFGIGFYQIIAAILNYVVDGYGHYSASGLAGVVMVRNIVGAIFPLFADQMFVALNNQRALTLIAGLAAGLVPIPFYFFYHGKTVRKKSPYCNEHFDEAQVIFTLHSPSSSDGVFFPVEFESFKHHPNEISALP